MRGYSCLLTTLLLPLNAHAYRVPADIGAPRTSGGASTPFSGANARTLADAAYLASTNRSMGSIGATDVSERPLNLDFVPRLGWKGTVFPSVASPVLCSIFASALALFLYERFLKGEV